MKTRAKIVLVIFILLSGLFLLFSCNKTENPTSLYITSPNKIVYNQKDINGGLVGVFEDEGIKVYGIYDSGAISIISTSSLTGPTLVGSVDDTSIPGVEIYTYSYNVSDNPDLKASFQLFYCASADGVYNPSAKAVSIGLSVVDSHFTYARGYEFDPSNVNYMVYYSDGTIYYSNPSETQANSDRQVNTTNLNLSLAYKANDEEGWWTNTDSDALRRVILRGGTYTVRYQIGNLETEIPVISTGGDEPIHIKYGSSKNWFDYLLVIWIAYLMNYTSFGIFALGIIFTTIIVRTLAWPIYANSNNMSFKMALAGPDLQKLEEKYRGKTDPYSTQQKQAETMKIYKKHGVKFSGCLLMLLQLPIFTAMWQVVRRITVPGGMFANTIHDSTAFGITNFFSAGASSWSFSHIFLVVIMAITYIALMLIGQKKPAYMKQTASHHKAPVKQNTKQAAAPGGMAGMGKMMVWVMTAVMIFMAFSNNNALTFYWIIGNLYSLGQTLLMRYINDRKYHLNVVKESLGSLYEDKHQRKVSYKQLVLDEIKNTYADEANKIQYPTGKNKFSLFLNKAVNVLYRIPSNFFRGISINIRTKQLEKLKNQNTLIRKGE